MCNIPKKDILLSAAALWLMLSILTAYMDASW